MRMLVAAAVLALAAAGSAPDATTIVALAAARPGERVHFTEQRSNALLSEALVFEGYVAMAEDGTLERVIERPFQERATIDGDRATLSRDGRVRRVNLDRAGRGGAYLRTLYALLRGDEQALEANFDLVVTGDRDQWQLTLTPSGRALGRWLETIVVYGSGNEAQRIRMERGNGGWQEMRLERDQP